MGTVCVVQARMGSRRFPGKVLADLNGEPMLAFMLKRLAPLERDGITVVVATTELPEDDVIQDLCHDRGIYCFRGSENDVLSRFVEVARSFDADTIIRLTGDCPLVWAGLVQWVLKCHDGRYSACFDVDGLEVQVYSRKMLEKLDKKADAPWDREHVACPLVLSPVAKVVLPKLSVDLPEDLVRVRDFLM